MKSSFGAWLHKNTPVKAETIEQREIGFERCVVQRVAARLRIGKSARPGQIRGSGSRTRLAVACRSLRRDPRKFCGLAHFLIIGADEFGEAAGRHLLGRGEFRTHVAQLARRWPAGKSIGDGFLQLPDDESRRAGERKYSDIALRGEVLHAALDEVKMLGKRAPLRLNRKGNSD